LLSFFSQGTSLKKIGFYLSKIPEYKPFANIDALGSYKVILGTEGKLKRRGH